MRENQKEFISIILIVAVAAALWSPFLHYPLRGDEAFSYLAFARHSIGSIISTYSDPNNHIFFNIIQHLVTNLVGAKPEIYLRLVAFLFSLLTIPTFFLLTKKITDYGHAVVACLLLISFPLNAVYAVNGRGYSMLVFFSIVSFYFSIQVNEWLNNHEMVKRPIPQKVVQHEVGAIIINVLGVWTVPTHIIYILAEGLFWIFQNPKAFKRKILWLVIRGGAICVLMTLCYSTILLQPDGFEKLTKNKFVQPLPFRGLLENFTSYLNEILRSLTGGNYFLIAVIGILGIVSAFYSFTDKRKNIFRLFPAMILSILIIIILTRTFPPPRTLIQFIPWICLLESILICRIGQNIVTKNSPHLANFIITLLISFGIFINQTKNFTKEARKSVIFDIRELTTLVEKIVADQNASITLDCCFNYVVPYYLKEESKYQFGQYFTYTLKDTQPINHFFLRKDHYSVNTLISYAITDIYGSGAFCSHSLINRFGPYQLYKLECE